MPRGTSLLDDAIQEGRFWTPAVARPALRLWLDADRLDSLTIASGDLSQWNDISGRGLHASQATASVRPTWNGVGGGVRFTSSAPDRMTGAALWSGSAGEHAIIFVLNVASSTTNTAFSLSGTADPTGRLSCHSPWVDGNIYWDAGSASAPERVSGAWGGTNGTAHILSCVSSNARAAQYVSRDGFLIASDSSGANITSVTINGYTVGALFNDGTNALDGTIYEFIVASETADWFVRDLEGYLAWKWRHLGTLERLAASHPFKNSPPVI